LSITACALLGRGRSPESRNREVSLHVTNQNFYDATLYAIDVGGTRQRIGIVPGNTEKTFTFRWSSIEMRIEIALLSVGSTVTGAMPIDAGDELELTITPDLHLRIP
jgi:hypothetical protein